MSFQSQYDIINKDPRVSMQTHCVTEDKRVTGRPALLSGTVSCVLEMEHSCAVTRILKSSQTQAKTTEG